MPLLVIAIITQVIYNAMTKGVEWGSDASRRAWAASAARSAELADRIRQRLLDKLDEWESDPRTRGYVAWTAKALGKTVKGIGKGTLWGLLAGARGAGAVARVLGGGAFARTGLLGALAQAVRTGTARGARWWRRRRGDRASEKANDWADRAERWGDTIPGETADPPPAEDWGPEDPWTKDDPTPDAEQPDVEHDDEPAEEAAREPYNAGTATVGDPVGQPAPAASPIPIGDSPEPAGNGQARSPEPTPVPWGGGGALGGTTGHGELVQDTPGPGNEGSDMSSVATTTGTGLAPAGGGTIAPLSTSADCMQYEQAQNFFREQEERANTLANLAEEIHQLQVRLGHAATIMATDHVTAQDALARFRIQAPNVSGSIDLLFNVAGKAASDQQMLEVFNSLNVVSVQMAADAANLRDRFQTAYEIISAENADAQFVNQSQ